MSSKHTVVAELLVPFRTPRRPGTPSDVTRVTVRQFIETVPQAVKGSWDISWCARPSVRACVLDTWDVHSLASATARRSQVRTLHWALPVLVEVEAEVSIEDLSKSLDLELASVDLEHLAYSIVLNSAGRAVASLLLAATIARPNTFDTRLAGEVPDEEDIQELLRFELLPECRNIAEKFGWPPLADIPLAHAWEWLRTIDGVAQGVGAGRLGRAIAALSYACSPAHQTESLLLWPLVGLEALYCRGSEGLQAQILEKSELLLGPRREFKKVFRRMYESRSRFVHGGFDMPLAHSRYDEHAGYDAFRTETKEALDLATSVLVSTLQRLCVERRTDLEFELQRRSAPA